MHVLLIKILITFNIYLAIDFHLINVFDNISKWNENHKASIPLNRWTKKMSDCILLTIGHDQSLHLLFFLHKKIFPAPLQELNLAFCKGHDYIHSIPFLLTSYLKFLALVINSGKYLVLNSSQDSNFIFTFLAKQQILHYIHRSQFHWLSCPKNYAFSWYELFQNQTSSLKLCVFSTVVVTVWHVTTLQL